MYNETVGSIAIQEGKATCVIGFHRNADGQWKTYNAASASQDGRMNTIAALINNKSQTVDEILGWLPKIDSFVLPGRDQRASAVTVSRQNIDYSDIINQMMDNGKWGYLQLED